MLLYKYFNKLISRPLYLSCLIVFLFAPTISYSQNFTFDKIVIEGNYNVDSETVESFMNLDVSKTVSASALNSAYQNIIESGLFKSVEIIPNGKTLRILVKEFALINSVSFDGNKRISNEILDGLVESTKNSSLNTIILQKDSESILEAYRTQGRLAASVQAKVIPRINNSVDLVFEVIEGNVTEIERISFVGNTSYSDARLRRILSSKEAGLMRAWFKSDSFLEDRVELDKTLLKTYYNDRGFVNFKILSSSSELSRDRNAYFLTFLIDEGEKFELEELTVVSSIPEVNLITLQKALKIKSGKVFSQSVVENRTNRLEALLKGMGVNFANVEAIISQDKKNRKINVLFNVNKGQPLYINRINITGNSTTRDYVIRRQFSSVEGDPFNRSEVKASVDKIRGLGFFSKVDVSTSPVDNNSALNIDVDVEETTTGSLGLGFTYSTDAGLGTAFNFSERNFLGRGQELSLDMSIGKDTGQTYLNFLEPQFYNREFSLGIKVGTETSSQQFSAFDSKRNLFEPSVGFPLTNRSDLKVHYGYADETLTAKSDNLSPAITRDMGNKELQKIGYKYTYDTRKASVDPDSSFRAVVEQSYVSSKSNFSYLKSSASLSRRNSFVTRDIELQSILEFGHMTQLEGTSRVTDRFKTYGNQMRGFSAAGMGPRDLYSSAKDSLGGLYYAVARFESEIPLRFVPSEYKMRGVLFLDAGSVWGLDNKIGTTGSSQPGGVVDDGLHLRSAIGFGLLWKTQIGPLRFNWTRPLLQETYDQTNLFNFTLSTNF
jgi:outer membrane protein insertion porin family